MSFLSKPTIATRTPTTNTKSPRCINGSPFPHKHQEKSYQTKQKNRNKCNFQKLTLPFFIFIFSQISRTPDNQSIQLNTNQHFSQFWFLPIPAYYHSIHCI
ncbi:hypothetical protein EVA_06991 [gut metagenome]|uniref:Uncharacterized protein n=1 Tax=gut metagenome TaxID=749906 RepID=J9GC41_9ZZZZ